MATGLRAQKVTLPTDAVTLHRWVLDAGQAGVFGEQIGEPIRVGEPGTVTFPTHRGEFAELHVVAWHDGRPMWFGGPLKVYDGDAVSMPLPIEGVLS